MPEALPPIIAALTITALAYAAWSDLATRILPNSTTLAIAAAGVAARAIAGPAALAWSIGLSVLLFFLLVFAHARGALGGGDVKLMSATTIGLAPLDSLHFLSATALAGGVLALLHLLGRRLPPPVPCPAGAPALRRVWRIERWRIRRHAPMPYGVAIAAGGAWALLSNLGS
ncbi:MAG: prepilin peptidase [Rhodopila sp.]|nr:prepilin peptidase [Rhodopila sp.]